MPQLVDATALLSSFQNWLQHRLMQAMFYLPSQGTASASSQDDVMLLQVTLWCHSSIYSGEPKSLASCIACPGGIHAAILKNNIADAQEYYPYGNWAGVI